MEPIINAASVVQHLNPVRRKKADYILRARLPDDNPGDSPKKWEQLWAKKLKDGTYEICCTPFSIYDLALGDRVKANDANILTEVVERSGNWTVRVWFGEVDAGRRKEMGCLMEWYSEYLLAINADSDKTAKDIVEHLKEKAITDNLEYETGWT